jgi:hypothetical protein
MPYRFVQTRADYTDLAAGQVLYNLPGRPAFPVRLASEIFQRCLAVREGAGAEGPCILYDPCCGGGYLLTTLAYLHWPSLRAVIGSDVDPEALRLAEKNLSLLTRAGLDARIAQIEAMKALYGKESHARSLESALRLSALWEEEFRLPLPARLFLADATDREQVSASLRGDAVDVVMTDLPYNQRTQWIVSEKALQSDQSPVWLLLDALLPVLSRRSVVAISANKAQKVAHGQYRRADQFQIGKRRITILMPL